MRPQWCGAAVATVLVGVLGLLSALELLHVNTGLGPAEWAWLWVGPVAFLALVQTQLLMGLRGEGCCIAPYWCCGCYRVRACRVCPACVSERSNDTVRPDVLHYVVMVAVDVSMLTLFLHFYQTYPETQLDWVASRHWSPATRPAGADTVILAHWWLLHALSLVALWVHLAVWLFSTLDQPVSSTGAEARLLPRGGGRPRTDDL